MPQSRTLLIYLLSFLIVTVIPLSTAMAQQDCGGEPGWAAAEFTGSVQSPDGFLHQEGAWELSLAQTPFGWRLRMFDLSGTELPTFAAPMRPVETNQLNIAGWHFRNQDNTGPNMGDVNAPQHRRRFAFGSLATTPLDTDPDEAVEGLGGFGELIISNYSLTPPEVGTQAALLTLDFSVCMVWQGGGDRLDPIAVIDSEAAFETATSSMIGCGLDASQFQPSDRMAQGRAGSQDPYLEADLDGDGIPDLIIPVSRQADQAPGLAICLLGDETLVLAGFSGRIGRHLDPSYFDRADFWTVHSGPIEQGVAEGAPPTLAGDAILLGKEDSSSVLFYLDQTLMPSSYWQGD